MRRMSLLRRWEIYRVMRSINIPRLWRYGIREFAGSITPVPTPHSPLSTPHFLINIRSCRRC